MRFSEAMRLGAMLRPRQAFWLLHDPSDNSTCAMGAACEAVGILDTIEYGGRYTGKGPQEWRWITMAMLCPACSHFHDQVQALVIHLNNDHRWTRERIADWVEAQETGLEASQPVSAAIGA